METAPMRGELLEFTFEAETRPMVSLDEKTLTRLQDAVEGVLGVYDPVFCLDEATGSVSAVFQVEATSAWLAAIKGSTFFLTLLNQAGLSSGEDVVERVESHLVTMGTKTPRLQLVNCYP